MAKTEGRLTAKNIDTAFDFTVCVDQPHSVNGALSFWQISDI